PEPGSNSPLKTGRSRFIERAISSFLMLTILLYIKEEIFIFIIHLFSFQRTRPFSSISTSQELDYIMLITFLSNLFLIFFFVTFAFEKRCSQNNVY
ncbi:hypothetical protein, partial [Paenibacillus farraposensis]|uniref:hypothetical protein n=1 Tax=Paenibacillus farraposensis TaxID=2807095 RepID=UPI001E4726E2